MPNKFYDTDWAKDKNEWKSTSGYTFFLGHEAIMWCSKKSYIALSMMKPYT